MDVTTDWYWEGNVVEAIVRFLEREDWSIVAKADTHSKERGIDIQAKKHGRIGRIFLSARTPRDQPWLWTITARERRPETRKGFAASREEAMAAF